MCSQVRGVIRNFIWGGKAAPTRAKVKCDTLTLPIAKGGLGIIDPKSQSEALLANLLVRGLAPGGEPWKELIRHHADQTRLPVHEKGPDTTNIHWIFAAPTLKRVPCSMWKSILGAWMSIRPSLAKREPSNLAELMKQPIFSNPSLTNVRGEPLGVNGHSEGCAFARAEHTRIRDFWNGDTEEWKNLSDLKMHVYASNKSTKDIIIGSIPWRPDSFSPCAQPGDWVSTPSLGTPLEWVYYVLEALADKVLMIEFRRIATSGQIRATNFQKLIIRPDNLSLIRVLSREKHGASLKVANDLPLANQRNKTYWIFESGIIKNLPWDPGEWHWKEVHPLGDAPFFRYTAKRGYKNVKSSLRSPGIITSIDNLNLRNSSISQVVARIWHNSRPRKVGTLIWLTFNQGLPTGTWLQVMGISPTCKTCSSGAPESP
jgi:hypothetical protein